jgi:site-specific DNA-methyltransferase (adenine-specific)
MSSPRQDVLSRMIVNLQDAGFETNFTSIYWTYASGFPKAANVSKLVDKRLGLERQPEPNPLAKKQTGQEAGKGLVGARNNNELIYPIPKSEQAKKLDGSYAGFQPKPAVEVILVVIKPLSEKSYVDQALKNGKGVTWLDNVRIPFQNESEKYVHANIKSSEGSNEGWQRPAHKNYTGLRYSHDKGRFPANLIVSDDSLNDGKITKNHKRTNVGTYLTGVNDGSRSIYGNYSGRTRQDDPQDSGSYSRYFDLDKWYDNRAQFIITPKASPSERNKGLENSIPKVERIVNNQNCKYCHVCNIKYANSITVCKCGGKLDIIEVENKPKQNHHPTVKPLKLMSYLITMGSRENDIILDPFCGSGTTCIAAYQLNRKFIGIELQKEYVDIANKRLEPYKIQNKITQF